MAELVLVRPMFPRPLRVISTGAFAFLCSAAAQSPTPPPLLARSPQAHVSQTIEEAERSGIVISHPKPDYPPDARLHHLAGRGLFHITVSYETGEVTSVAVESSTGHEILDDAAAQALKRWKFRRHTIIGLKVPITFIAPRKT